MTDDNLPAAAGPVTDDSAPLSLDSAAAGLTDILKDDPATDPAPENEDPEQAAESEGDQPESNAEDVENQETAEESDGPQGDYEGGRFAADNAKVRLDDGTVISVADLKRNNLFQRDYTKKTTELSEKAKAFEAREAEVSQFAQSLEQFRDYIAGYAEQYLPKQPEPFDGNPATDPVAYMQWQHANNQWAQHVQAYQAIQQQKQQDAERKNAEMQKASQERLEREREALLKAWPVLKDPAKGKQAWDGLVSGATQRYGITADEVNSAADHRFIQVLRDALEYRKIKEAAPKVQQEVRKPAMQDGRRPAHAPREQAQKQIQSERFRQTGSLDDAAALLRNLVS